MQSDYNDLTVVKLKALCKEQNLPISGRKSELIERLIANDNSKYDNEEEIEQTTEEGTEEKKKFKCIECSTVLRVPLTYKGMISCPTCSTRQEVGEEVKDHPLKQGHSEGYPFMRNSLKGIQWVQHRAMASTICFCTCSS